MYVQHSVHISHPVEQCADVLARAPKTWFPNLRENGRTAVGMRVAGISVHKKVAVELGEPERKGDWTKVPISWKATFPERLFPVLFGHLELVPVDKGVTRLTVSGMYEPPLGKLGELIDDAMMHGVAVATVREVAESIARQVSAALDSTPAPGGVG